MNKPELRYFHDRDGAPRAEGSDDTARVLALFLESDIQEDEGLCRELLADISDLGPEDEPVEFVGNAFAASFGPETVAIAGHSEGNDHSAMVDRDRVELALQGWLDFIGR